MYTLLPADESSNLGARLQKAMERHSSLWISLFVAYGRSFAFAVWSLLFYCSHYLISILQAGLKVIQDCLAFLQPQLLRLLLSYITSYQRSREEGVKGPSPYEGFAITILMFSAAMTQTVILHQVRCYDCCL
jgi:ATP-binding cassette, subfamily C (CFTR/MRP), member 1